MDILVFYVVIVLLFIGIWEAVERLLGAMRWLWRRRYFAKRHRPIKAGNIMEDCKIWKKELDDIYENKKKET